MKATANPYKYIFPMVVTIAMMLFISCDEILEENVEDSEVLLVTPKDGYHTNNPKVTFNWLPVDGASHYNLYIASPALDLDSIERIVLDTNITGTTFTAVLSQGKYQWAVMAWNGVSQTQWYYRDLSIDSVAVPVVIPLNPSDNKALNSNSVTFTWNGNEGDQFIFSLLFQEQLLYTTITGEMELTLPDAAGNTFELEEGAYTWQLQARNQGGAVSDVEERTFLIDRTQPGKPTPLAPGNDSLFTTTPISLEWKRLEDTGSELFDSLFMATDSLFTELEESVRLATETSFDFVPAGNGKYFWKVKTCDAAGNSSAFSNTITFRYNAE